MKRYTKREVFDPASLPLAVYRRTHLRDEALHAHQFSEIVIVLGGSGVHSVGKHEASIRAGDVYVLSGKRQHAYLRPKNLKIIDLLFDPATLNLPMRDIKSIPGYHVLFTLEPACRSSAKYTSCLNLPPADLARVDAWIVELENELCEKPPGYRFMACAHFMRIVGHLSRRHHRAHDPAPEATLRLSDVLCHLENHFDEPISLGDLAKTAHMSKRNFIRTFHRVLGCSPIQYLIELRVARAAEFLKRGTLSVTEIAQRTGFQDSNYFSRQFRRIMSESPREHRRRALFAAE